MSKGQKIIMHLIATNFYGGPEKQIVEHLRRLNENGGYCRGLVASFLEGSRQNELLVRAKLAGLRHYGIPMFGPLDVRAQWQLTRVMRQEKVDLLCAHGYKSCVMGWWVSTRSKIPIIAFSRGYTAESKKIAFYEWLDRRVLGRMTGIVAVSEGQRKRLGSFGIQGRRSWVVHNAVSVDSSSECQELKRRRAVVKSLGIQENSALVVTAGRFSPEKGHRYLINAIASMGKDRNGTYFIFCGEGVCQEDLEKQAKDLGVYHQCRFAGFRRDLKEIFQAMDFMVLPSLTEGLPNVVLEAFACRKPVVATGVGGVPEVVEHGVNGFLVPPKRPDLLAEAIKKCLSSPSIARQMGKAGYQKVKSEFTFEVQTRKLEAVYREVLERSW